MGPNFTEWLVTVHIFMYSYGIPMCSCGSQQYICIVMGHNIIYVHRYGSLLLPSKASHKHICDWLCETLQNCYKIM